MIKIFPSYYKRFKCIKGACRHSCCIGWEIDVDEEKLSFYGQIKGALGKRLKERISLEETPHFILCEGERCPFLNNENLCDLIIELGEDALCTICHEHPRFYNELPDRLECGLGLCCEEAGRLILTQERFSLLAEKDGCIVPLSVNEDPLLQSREWFFELVGAESSSLFSCIPEILEHLGTTELPLDSTSFSVELYKLDRLDKTWTLLLEELLCEEKLNDEKDRAEYDARLGELRFAFTRFFLYLIYRYYANAFDERDAAARGLFALQSALLLNDLAFIKWRKTGSLSAEDIVELARLFSSEIEYSEENIEALFDLFFEFFNEKKER